MTEYRYEKPDRIILLGGGRTMWEFRTWLMERAFPVGAYTAPRQVTPQTQGTSCIVESVPDVALSLISDRTLGICFGPAWAIPDAIRRSLGHRLLDFMSIPFPAFQGGAHETWAALTNQKTWGCCLQLVTENTVQGECHDGEVIHQTRFPYADREAKQLEFLQGFIEKVEQGTTFAGVTPVDGAITFPRLNTAKNGWIDWSWSVQEIARFLTAFAGYGGAGTYSGDQEIRLPPAESWAESGFHPFCAGLVLDVTGTSVRIACRNGSLRINRAADWTLKPGDRLHTPGHVLEAARLYVPSYDANGDSKVLPVYEIRSRPPATTTANYLAADPLRIQLLRPEDVSDAYVDWLNDPQVNRYLEVRHLHWHRESVIDYVKACQSAYEETALFGIYLHNRHIGNIKIGPVNDRHLHADLSYFIGEKSLWGKGYATKAVRLAIGWAFQHLKLHRLQAGTYADNGASEKVLLRAGFTHEATLRQQLLLDGQWTDHNLFALTNPAWTP